jgi:hypothetical protein
MLEAGEITQEIFDLMKQEDLKRQQEEEAQRQENAARLQTLNQGKTGNTTEEDESAQGGDISGPKTEDEGAAKERDYADDLRRKLERRLSKDVGASLKKAFALLKGRVMAEAKGEKQIMTLPDDPALWEKMRVEIRGAIQPHVRDIAMAAAQYKMDLGIAVDMNKVNLDILKFTREYTNDWWAKLEATRREGLREALMTWQESGLGKRGLPDLLDAMETVFFDKVSADMIAVTEVTRIFDEGNRIIEREAGIKTQEWLTARDETVCDICLPLDGKEFPIDQGPYPVTDSHPNCLLPDNEIMIAQLEAGSRAFYSGDAIELRTSMGNMLTITPNHMVLTPHGFTKAKSLRQGEYIVSGLDAEGIISSIEPDRNHSPAAIEQIWDSLQKSPRMFRATMPAAPVDFYGDARGFNGDIDIVYPQSLLLRHTQSLLPQHISHDIFDRRCVDKDALVSSCPLHLTAFTDASASNGGMTRRCKLLPFLLGHSGESDTIGLTSIAGNDARLQQPIADNHARHSRLLTQRQFRLPGNVTGDQVRGNNHLAVKASNAVLSEDATEDIGCYRELSTQILHTFASQVTLDKILDIRHFNFTGHVYDLQSTQQWYIANRVLVKNCRCMRTGVTDV